jgi:putative hydrolase of the HAD superfamily
MDIRIDKSTAVIFDLDDTLYNEIAYLKSAYREIASFLEPKENMVLYAQMFSLYRNKIDVFEFLADNYVIDKKELLNRYREHKPQIRPFESVLFLLESIRDKQGKTGILTDGREITQMNKIEALGIGPLIDKTIISEVIGSEKPSANNFRAMTDSLPADRYFYIGDNLKKDFITPNAMGWKTIGVLDNGLNIHSDAYLYMNKKHRPHFFVYDLTEIRITG